MRYQTYPTENVYHSFRDYADYFMQPFKCFKNNTRIKGLFKIEFERILQDKRSFDLGMEEIALLKIKKNSQENFFYEFFKKYESSGDLSIERKFGATNIDFFNYIENFHEVSKIALKRKYLKDFKEFFTILKSNKSSNEKKEIQNNDAVFDINLSNSKAFKSLFVNKELFDKINFTILKKKGIIYNKNSNELKLNSRRVASDVTILVSYLISIDLIKIKYGEKYLKQVSEVCESIGVKFDKSFTSRIYNAIENKRHLSSENSEVLENIKEFISRYQ